MSGIEITSEAYDHIAVLNSIRQRELKIITIVSAFILYPLEIGIIGDRHLAPNDLNLPAIASRHQRIARILVIAVKGIPEIMALCNRDTVALPCTFDSRRVYDVGVGMFVRTEIHHALLRLAAVQQRVRHVIDCHGDVILAVREKVVIRLARPEH